MTRTATQCIRWLPVRISERGEPELSYVVESSVVGSSVGESSSPGGDRCGGTSIQASASDRARPIGLNAHHDH